MKKHSLLFLLVIMLSITLFSCSGESSTSNIEMTENDFFDYEKKHYPSEDDFSGLEVAMPLKKVFDIIGKPHSFGPTSGVVSLEWETEDGTIFLIYVTMDSYDASNGSLFYHLYNTGSIMSIPIKLE